MDRVADEAAALAPGDRGPLAAALAHAAYRRSEARPASAAARVVGLLLLMERRPTGTMRVRAFNPTQAEHGYRTAGSVVEVSVEDRPFLVTTLVEELRRLGLTAVVTVHPVVGVERDAVGALAAITPARDAPVREALLHVELAEHLDLQRLDELVPSLTRVLGDALAVTGDFARMRARLDEAAFELRAAAGARYPADEVDETNALLRWLLDEHVILLGSSSYERDDAASAEAGGPRLRTVPGSGLGILREDADAGAPAEPSVVREGRLVALSRGARVSTVHRQVRMLELAVRTVDDHGELAGEHRVLGLFAQRAYAEPASGTPVLRRLLREILEREDIVDHSHDERQVRSLFEAFPKHELFAADPDELRATLVALLAARRDQDVRVIGRANDGGGLSIVVAIPRDRFSAEVRQRVQQLLVSRFGATGVDYHLSLDEQNQALLQFTLTVGEAEAELLDAARLDELERAVVGLTRTFTDVLAAELRRTSEPSEALRRAEAFAARVPFGYRETTAARTAVRDLGEIDALAAAGAAARVWFRHDTADPPERFHLRLYTPDSPVELSDFLPILESLGLTVAGEVTHRVEPPADRPGPSPGVVHVHDFGVRADRNLFRPIAVDVDRDGPRLADTVIAVLRGWCERDSLNRLILAAGLRWPDVDVLRTYRHYRRQVGTTFTPRFLSDALVAHPDVAAALVGLFGVRFDPLRESSPQIEATARQRVLDALATVDRFDADRILRGFLGLVDATLRTNRYVPKRSEEPEALALKFDSTRVPDMPRPVPAVEVFVSGAGMQGIHLRGGPVARGGLRWSDRSEDFRTEVLGLMKAQMTKNAIIVPTGSKGGFVLTRPSSDPLAVRDQVRAAYEVFVRALLDVTDDVDGERVVGPPGVRRHDGDDPYLVVAADRGTATFSDLANSIAAEYGFWLGDAFASGGSAGYDHKAMGITARGAWQAVRRHFRELDVDVATDPVRVVGVGDMSGDVFGNGMLLSRSLRLVAAFDHRDVFLDPDPDPETAFDERERLFRLPTSSWRDYERSLISPGGGVWSRTAREVVLSEQARALLGVDAAALSPPALIRALLRAPTDLLWFGGIGTFVRASTETDLDVGDRANDPIRVVAGDLGARVVGEGGNLAMTQRARIQYSRRGGRCNTDAIDNAGGVDTSDREVNLKILLRDAIEAGSLDPGQRDDLLAAMADEVAAAVLRDVDLQTAAISAELAAAPRMLDAYGVLMDDLVEAGRLDREVEVLPDAAELERRREMGAGLVRPELAVLLGYAKVDHIARLLASDLPDEPWLRTALDRYFPRLAVERFPELISSHRLRRELVATAVANDLLDRMGITYISRTAHELGCMAWEVAAAWTAAREVTDADLHWDAIDTLADRTTPELQHELEAEVDRLVDVLTRTYLRHRVGSDVGAVVARDAPALAELAKAVEDVGPPARRAARQVRAQRWADLGVEPDLGDRLAVLRDLTIVPDVATVAVEGGQSVRHVGEVFWRLSESLPLDDLSARVTQARTVGSWQSWQQRGLVDELRELRRAGAGRVIAVHPDLEPAAAVAAFLDDRADARHRVRVLLSALDREPDGGLDGLAVVVRALRVTMTGSA